MSIPAFSPAWADALRSAVNSDATYREAGRRWSDPVALIVHPHERLPDGVAVQVDLDGGSCSAAQSLAPESVTAPFVLSATLEVWREIMDGVTDPIAAVTRGKVSVTHGSIGTLMLHAKSARALLACTQTINTGWP